MHELACDINVTLKKLVSHIACLSIAALLLLFDLSCSNKNQSNVSSTVAIPSPSTQPASTSQEKRDIHDVFPILLAIDSGLPVSVIGLQFLKEGNRKGDLQVQIKNVSENPIKTVQYWLAPMPCRQYDIPDLIIDYDDAVLNPSQTANVFVGRKLLEDYLNPKGQSSIECSSKPEEKPHLFLAKVSFNDGSVWGIDRRINSSDSR